MAKKKTLIVAIIVALLGCGVSQEEFDKLTLQNTALKKENVSLKEKLDLSIVKANASKLKAQLDLYKTGTADDLVAIIKDLDLKNNTHKLGEIYGNNTGVIITSLSKIEELNKGYNEKNNLCQEKSKEMDDLIQEKKTELENLDVNGYKYVNLVVGRRFDTDETTGKGGYEALDFSSYKKVILLANEDEVGADYRQQPKRFFVKSLGQNPTTVVRGNAYHSESIDEYYEYFETVDKSLNPEIKKAALAKLVNEDAELKREYAKIKAEALDVITELTKAEIYKLNKVL